LNGWKPTYVIKPDKPRPDTHRDGTPKIKPDGTPKMRKYEYAAGSPNRLDVPPRTQAVAEDPSVPVLITEGIKKVDKATAAGYHCIGLGGVWSWLGKHDTPFSMPIPDFGYFAWKDRRVAIVFDSDVATNKNVCEARRRLKLFLESLRAVVLFIDLPPAADGAKMGLDDYLVTNPDARLWDMAYDPVDERFAAMEHRLEEFQAELDTHRDEYRWNHDLDGVPNKLLSGGDKSVLRDIRRATRRAGDAAYREPQTLYYGERVKHTGQSKQAYGAAVKRLAETGAVELVKGTYESSGKPKVSVVLRPAFDKPAQLARPEPSKAGGARPKHVAVCEDCGPKAGVTELKATTYGCNGCGAPLRIVRSEPTELVRSTLQPRDCYPVEPTEPEETTTDANMHRSGATTEEAGDEETGTVPYLERKVVVDHPGTHPYPVRSKYGTVPEPPPYEAGYLESLAGTAPPAQGYATDLDIDPWPRPAPTVTLLEAPAAAPPCDNFHRECLEPTYCAKQGKCRWAPQAGGTR
jgi:hypothetical protein